MPLLLYLLSNILFDFLPNFMHFHFLLLDVILDLRDAYVHFSVGIV